MSGECLSVDGICDTQKIKINGTLYDKSELMQFDVKRLKACILRMEAELKNAKNL